MGSLFIALLLLIALCAPALAEDSQRVNVYASDFSRGADGWYARGASGVSAQGGALLTTGRSSDWHSPGRDFDLVEGCEYELSVLVRQQEKDSASFMISVAHTLNGAESYENLARGTAKKGEWAEIKGTYTPGHFSRFVLYVETTGAADLSYEIKDFRVTSLSGVPERKPTEPPMLIAEAENLPSLKDVYADAFDFGSAVPAFALMNPAVKEFILSQFNILTPENEMKPDSVLDVNASKKLSAQDETAVAVKFDAARALLDFAKENGLKVHGHVLVWHSQTPEAFFHEGYDAARPYVGRDVMLGRMENYIKAVFEYTEANYPGVIVSWDVVNEAIDDGTNKLRQSNWFKTVGEDSVLRAFEYARKYAPEGTLLYYNDYNTAMPGKLNGIANLLKALIAEGNIDGYGFQMHHSVGFPSMEMISASVERIAGMGLKLRVSELDVGTDGNTESSFTKQAEKYAAIMRLLLDHKDQMEAVQVWGLTDDMSWRRANYPLLFDGKFNPKPAFYAVADPYEK